MTDKQPQGLGDRIQQLMKGKELTAKHLAEQVGISPSVLSGWLQGQSPRDFEKAARLAEVLGVSLSYLLTGKPERTLSSSQTLAELVEGRETVLEGFLEVSIKRIILKGNKK